MNLVLVISSLGAGGAERVMSVLANQWAQNGYTVNLITLADKATDFYALNPSVTRTDLALQKDSSGLIDRLVTTVKRLLLLRKTILSTRPDAVISFIDTTNMLACLALAGTRVPLIVSERTNPFVYKIGRLHALMRPMLYRHFCRAVVVQTEAVKERCVAEWHCEHVVRIPNPLFFVRGSERTYKQTNVVLSVGRLVPSKGFDVLISAFARISHKHPGWTLEIVGEGPDRPRLESLIREVDMTARITLLGETKNISERYENSEIFCLTSRFEGFPNVLLEALAMGCACISTDCESGPREILDGGRLGVLVPVDSIDAVALSLHAFISDKELRATYQRHGNYLSEFYSAARISDQWLDIAKRARQQSDMSVFYSSF